MKKLLIKLGILIAVYLGLTYSIISYAATTTDTGQVNLNILPGIDTLYAPALILHDTVLTSPQSQTSEYLWDENATGLEYIGFDLGSGTVDFDIAASISSTFSGASTSETFNAENVEIKGCKQTGYCDADNWPYKIYGTETPDNCVKFVPGNDTNYTTIGSSGITLVDDGVGGTGSNCTALAARWMFVPATKIYLPGGVTPDFYQTNLTFTLTTR